MIINNTELAHDAKSLSLNHIESDFPYDSSDFVGQVRLIGRDSGFWIFSSVQWVDVEDRSHNPFEEMMDLQKQPYSHENHQRYFSAWLDLCSDEWPTKRVIKRQYKVKIIGYPVYSYWYNSIRGAKLDACENLDDWRNKKLRKRNERIFVETGGKHGVESQKSIAARKKATRNRKTIIEYRYEPIFRFEGKCWCVAPKSKYPDAIYETPQELAAGCNMSCVAACRKRAIKVTNITSNKEHLAADINHKKCVDCGECAAACPNGNIVKHNITRAVKITLANNMANQGK
jgi:formate hydrogenlyase subunit 6/NADH:ubiquinone oxidoreductase subunit I